MSTILLVANDVGPCRALKELASGMSAIRGLIVKSFFNFGGESCNQNLDGEVSLADAVIVGMSCNLKLAKDELHVAEKALASRKPLFLLADTFGVRPHFDSILSRDGVTLFHVSENEADEARKRYPNLKVVATGNPVWENFFFPAMSREESREMLGVKPEEKIILCPGGKDTVVNTLHFNHVIERCSENLQNCTVIVSLHPGDLTPEEKYWTFIEHAPSNTNVSVISGNKTKATDILQGSDLLYSSASTIEIEALCREEIIPTCCFLSPLAKRRLRRSTGNDEWELEVRRLSLSGSNAPFDWVYLKLGVSDWDDYVLRVRNFFPKPVERGQAVNRMLDCIFNS
jgi:hypothetical protein